MSPKILAIIAALVLFVVVGMVLTVKKSAKPRELDPNAIPKSAPAPAKK
jgi:hypothetical protein